MKVHDIIGEGPNRYSTTSTNDAGVTTTKMPGGYKSVQNNVGEDSISTRTTSTVNNGNRTFRKHIQKSTDTGGTSLTKVSNNGTTTKRFVRPGGSGTQTTVTPSGEVSRKNFQLKGPQTWAYDKPKTNLNASKKIKEDGVIVPGVNTTVDVKPGQTEKEAAKFFGKGKPEELHKKARKNSDPNTLYNLGLAEREIKQSDPITVLNKVMNRKVNEPFPIRIHDGSTVGVSPRLAKRIVDVYDSLESEKKQKIEFLLKTKNGFKQLADLVLNMSRVSIAGLQEKKK